MSDTKPSHVKESSQPVLSSELLLKDDDLPIHRAAYRGHNSTLASTLANGIDGDVDSLSASELIHIHLAIRGNQIDAVRILLSSGAGATLEETSTHSKDLWMPFITPHFTGRNTP